MVLVVMSAVWLVVAGLLGVLAAVKLHAPGMLADHAWLTYGRVQPAAWNAFVFGFATPAGLAMALWMTARMSAAPLVGGGVVILGALLWNIGLKLGMWGILAGETTGFEGLELPRYASPVLLAGYLLIAPWAFLTYDRRAERESYISQWYLLAALLVFPWAFAAGHMGTSFLPLRGVLQAAVQAWYLQNLYSLWLGGLGLAAVFYVIPKVTGAAIPSRNLALLGFWSLVTFGGLGGLTRYSGGPFPAWMISIAVVAGGFGLFPVVAVGVNAFGALRGQAGRVRSHPVLWFGVTALVVFLAAGVLSAINSLASVRHLTQFTLVGPGLDQLTAVGFCAMALFGVLYFMVPRLTGIDWVVPGLVRLHFFLGAGGAMLIALVSLPGGVWQGLALNDPDLSFLAVVRRCLPFVSAGTLAQLILLFGSLVFALSLLMVLAAAARRAWVPSVRQWVAPVASEVKA